MSKYICRSDAANNVRELRYMTGVDSSATFYKSHGFDQTISNSEMLVGLILKSSPNQIYRSIFQWNWAKKLINLSSGTRETIQDQKVSETYLIMVKKLQVSFIKKG